ncbi:MAG: type IV secretion system DNA-binding domain-containing protein [Candidatus Campbellbacteria bacterium]|nr:type IV secretion system DNA-binding domain-containing protein [Candidatus Campbellbacteria bacterium]
MIFSGAEERITYIGETQTRGRLQKFGIKAKDRATHMYVIGKSGMGKSTLLENMATQDINNGEGLMLIDPHGASVETLLDIIPERRVDDVVYFAPFDTDYPIGFNIMEDVGYEKRHLVMSGLLSAFKKIWEESQWSSRMEYLLSNTILALLEYPDSTIIDVGRMYSDKIFRKDVISQIKDPQVKKYWVQDFASYTDRYAAEATPAIQNKIGQFVANPLIRNIVAQKKSTFDLREIIDNRKIFLVNISKGQIGEVNASLLGSMLTTKLYLAALSRAETSPSEMKKLPRFFFYVDEFQSIANGSFTDILAEARKYKLSLIIAHQFVGQMEDEIRDAVLGNVGTIVSFRIGPLDAELLEKAFANQVLQEDLINLGFKEIYTSISIDGVATDPFYAETLPPIESDQESFRDRILFASREKYARRREEIEKDIMVKIEMDMKQAGALGGQGGKGKKGSFGGGGVGGNHGSGGGGRPKDKNGSNINIPPKEKSLKNLLTDIKKEGEQNQEYVKKHKEEVSKIKKGEIPPGPEEKGEKDEGWESISSLLKKTQRENDK